MRKLVEDSTYKCYKNVLSVISALSLSHKVFFVSFNVLQLDIADGVEVIVEVLFMF